MTKTKMKPNEVLPLFDAFLAKEKEKFEAIIIGGGALSVLGVIPRMTSDFDVLDPDVPETILKLALRFREMVAPQGIRLGEDWPKIVGEATSYIAKRLGHEL